MNDATWEKFQEFKYRYNLIEAQKQNKYWKEVDLKANLFFLFWIVMSFITCFWR